MVSQAWRVTLFVTYSVVSVYILVKLVEEKGCMVRHTYRQEFLASLAANPMYSASQILREPPLSMPEIQEGVAVPNPQRVADIAVFPVGIADPVKHAAFWPVRLDPGLNLDTFLADQGTGGLSELHSLLLSSEDYRHLNGTIERLMAYPYTSLVRLPPGSERPNPSQPLVEEPGMYHVTRTGAVVSLVANGLPATEEVAAFATSLKAQSMNPARTSGMLPNVARCVSELPENADAAQRESWMRELADLAAHSFRRGTCLLTGQQRMVDISPNFKTSIALFSSVNPLFMLLIVMWITASFALFYIRFPVLFGWDPKQASAGFWFTAYAPVIWNFGLMVAIVFPGFYDSLNVPLNNIFLGIGALFVAIVIQFMWGTEEMVAEENAVEEQAAEESPADSVAATIGFSGAGNADRTVPPVSGQQVQASLFSAGNLGGFLHASAQRQQFSGGYTEIPLGAFYEKSDYIGASESKKQMVHLRLTEYAIVNPLLIASVLASTSTLVPTYVVQFTFLTLVVFHVMTISLNKYAQFTHKVRQSDDTLSKMAALQGLVVFSFAALLMFVVGIFCFIYYAALAYQTYSPDTTLVAATWILVVFEFFFGLLLSLHTMVWAFSGFDVSAADAPEQDMERKAAGNFNDWAETLYGGVNLMTKVVVVSMVFASVLENKLPGQGCMIWANMQ